MIHGKNRALEIVPMAWNWPGWLEKKQGNKNDRKQSETIIYIYLYNISEMQF